MVWCASYNSHRIAFMYVPEKIILRKAFFAKHYHPKVNLHINILQKFTTTFLILFIASSNAQGTDNVIAANENSFGFWRMALLIIVPFLMVIVLQQKHFIKEKVLKYLCFLLKDMVLKEHKAHVPTKLVVIKGEVIYKSEKKEQYLYC